MKKSQLEILSDWIEETPQITRSLLKEKILLIQSMSKAETKKRTTSETSRFVKPTIPEIAEYCTERENNIDAQQFFDHYESKGWLIGKVKMKDWKACVRTWEKNKTNTVTNGNNNLPRINRQSHEDIRQNSTGWGTR